MTNLEGLTMAVLIGVIASIVIAHIMMLDTSEMIGAVHALPQLTK